VSPNPLNPSTTISFVLSRPGSVRLDVYDVSGRLVKALANEFMGTGPHSVGWDGTSRQGARVASGVYFYVLQTPELTVKSHLVVAK
jgi:flagellar hook assembly protein FlgD